MRPLPHHCNRIAHKSRQQILCWHPFQPAQGIMNSILMWPSGSASWVYYFDTKQGFIWKSPSKSHPISVRRFLERLALLSFFIALCELKDCCYDLWLVKKSTSRMALHEQLSTMPPKEEFHNYDTIYYQAHRFYFTCFIGGGTSLLPLQPGSLLKGL